MLKRIFARFTPARASTEPLTDEQRLELERELQSQRLTLQEQGQEMQRLQAEVERLRDAARAQATAQAQIEQLVRDLAAPVAQVLTQAHLAEAGRPVQTRDVLAVVRRIVRALEAHGLTVEGVIGESVAFDPDRHMPLGGGNAPAAGQPVVVRMVGVAYQGQVVQKAGVE